MVDVTDNQYQLLLVFRTALRRFLQWSTLEASRAGVTPQQHQLLLAVRGHPGPRAPSIREISDYLLIRHHSAVELVTRAQNSGLVRRTSDTDDQRVIRVGLTDAGEELVSRLAVVHLRELERIAQLLGMSVQTLEGLSHEFAEEFSAFLTDDGNGDAEGGYHGTDPQGS